MNSFGLFSNSNSNGSALRRIIIIIIIVTTYLTKVNPSADAVING